MVNSCHLGQRFSKGRGQKRDWDRRGMSEVLKLYPLHKGRAHALELVRSLGPHSACTEAKLDWLLACSQLVLCLLRDSEQGICLASLGRGMSCIVYVRQVSVLYFLVRLEALEVVKNSAVKTIKALQTLARLLNQVVSDIARHRYRLRRLST